MCRYGQWRVDDLENWEIEIMGIFESMIPTKIGISHAPKSA
jgi:hypothetical protein